MPALHGALQGKIAELEASYRALEGRSDPGAIEQRNRLQVAIRRHEDALGRQEQRSASRLMTMRAAAAAGDPWARASLRGADAGDLEIIEHNSEIRSGEDHGTRQARQALAEVAVRGEVELAEASGAPHVGLTYREVIEAREKAYADARQHKAVLEDTIAAFQILYGPAWPTAAHEGDVTFAWGALANLRVSTTRALGLDKRRAELEAEAERLQPGSMRRFHEQVRRSGGRTGFEQATANFKALTTRSDDVPLLRLESGADGTDDDAPQVMRRQGDPWQIRTGMQANAPTELRGRALAAVERTGDAPDEGRQRITEMIEERAADHPEAVLAAQYAVAVSDPAYRSAFHHLLRDPATGHREFSAEELAAYQRAQHINRALQVGAGTSSAGLMAPYTLDPSWMLTSASAVDPIRRRATVTTIIGFEWRGISTSGVTARWAPESSETPDASPTLAQPIIRPEKADVFVPFSIEATQDAINLEDEIRKAYEDARFTLEAAGWITGLGVGSDQPQGLLTALTGSASEVSTAGAGALVVNDMYALAEALPARFRANASWLMSRNMYHRTRRLVPQGSTTEALLYSADERLLLGMPWDEASNMPIVLTTGTTIIIFGDLARGYRVVDRAGLTIELVPHLLGAARRPIGERGLYGYWRTSGGVVNLSALRALNT